MPCCFGGTSLPSARKDSAVSRIYIRFATPSDADRLVKDEVLVGTPPPGSTWHQRAAVWLSEQKTGHRFVLVAEDHSGLLGIVQLVLKFPDGYNDPEAANGMDVAMMEGLRTRATAPKEVAEQLVDEIQSLARKRAIKTLTFCLSMDQNKALAQARQWGFEEFRIMPEKRGMMAFFRKAFD